jgi:aryl-alcohol dehydrogenase-like predicted oxidoreductase
MSNLDRRILGGTGLEITRIGLGALEVGRDWGIGNAQQRLRPAEEEAGKVLNGTLDLGINIIDTARAYHRSEERIGKFLSNRRSEYVLASKCGEHSKEPQTYYDFSYQAVSESINLSLKLLQTDVIDIMQVHFGPDPDRVLDEGGTVRAMKDARESGKVRFLGASPGMGQFARCIECGDFDVLQVAYSLLDQSAKELISRAADKGIGVLIRSGLGGGWLTSRTECVPADQWPEGVRCIMEMIDNNVETLHHLALAFLKCHPGISSVLVGTKCLDNLVNNIRLWGTDIDPDLLKRAAAWQS